MGNKCVTDLASMAYDVYNLLLIQPATPTFDPLFVLLRGLCVNQPVSRRVATIDSGTGSCLLLLLEDRVGLVELLLDLVHLVLGRGVALRKDM